MIKTFASRLRQFQSETQGYITIEAIIVLPMLLWMFGIGWIFFNALHQQNVNQKANYVIGDMLSRETDPITDEYVDNTLGLLQQLTKSSGADTDLRISVVEYDAESAEWELQWTELRGDQSNLSKSDVNARIDNLPEANDGDQLILVETWDWHSPLLDIGLSAHEITTYSFTRPRYAPQLVFASS